MIIISNVLQITEECCFRYNKPPYRCRYCNKKLQKELVTIDQFYSGRCGKEIENGTKIIEK